MAGGPPAKLAYPTTPLTLTLRTVFNLQPKTQMMTVLSILILCNSAFAALLLLRLVHLVRIPLRIAYLLTRIGSDETH